MKIATRSSKVGNAEKKKDTAEDNYPTTLLWFVLKIKRLKEGEMEPVFVGSLSAKPDMWQSEEFNHMKFKTTSRSLRMVTQNFEIPQIALHSDK